VLDAVVQGAVVDEADSGAPDALGHDFGAANNVERDFVERVPHFAHALLLTLA
jgi:hypothetical protein